MRMLRGGAYLWVSNVAVSMRWYQEKLGLTGYPYPDHEPYVYANLHSARPGICFVLLNPVAYAQQGVRVPPDPTRPVIVDIDVDDLEGVYADLGKSVTIDQPLTRDAQGLFQFAICDPDGHVLVFHQTPEGARGEGSGSSTGGMTTRESTP